MLEIKTIIKKLGYQNEFDCMVNDALASGWELARRDFFSDTSTPEHCVFLYAELEREVEPEEEEEPEDDGTAEWKLSRTPALPFKCTACGHHSEDAPKTCPNCGRVMTGGAL